VSFHTARDRNRFERQALGERYLGRPLMQPLAVARVTLRRIVNLTYRRIRVRSNPVFGRQAFATNGTARMTDRIVRDGIKPSSSYHATNNSRASRTVPACTIA